MDYYLKLAIIISISVVVVALCVIFGILIYKKKKNKEQEEFPELLEALGGKVNITEVSQKGSRVNVIVGNKKNVDKDKVREQGVETIVVSNKKVTMLVGSKKSVLIYNYLKGEVDM
jgi:phosphotransferase system IIB component